MPQLHLYVSDDVAAEISRRAEAEGLSVSRFLARLVREGLPADWPDEYFERVVGGWVGAPLERPPQGEIEVRETIG